METDLTARLKNIWTSPELQQILRVYQQHDAELRLVGGCVRDAVMDLPVGDIDLASGALPEQGMAWLQEAGIHVVPTGIKHGTLTAVINRTPYEITTLRRDVMTDGRHAVVAFGTSWAEDAQRRDFTMNGLSCDPAGQIADHVGGLADIADGRIRFIGDAEQRCREDYLRILRLFRFWARFGKLALDDTTLDAVAQCADGLAGLSAQRVWCEIKKLLATPRADEAVDVMQRNGILTAVLKDQFYKTEQLAVLADTETACADIPVSTTALRRLATLCSYRTQTGWTIDRHGLQTCFALSNAESDYLRDLHKIGQAVLWWTDRLMAALATFDRAVVIDACLMTVALGHENMAALHAVLPDLLAVASPVFPVTANDVMTEKALQPGPELGRALNKMRDYWLETNCVATKDECLNILI